MTLASLATCIDMLTRVADSIAMFDDPQVPDAERAIARLAIQHASESRAYVEQLKAMPAKEKL